MSESMQDRATFPRRVRTGIAGLDEITYGGLPEGELYVVQGAPGSGKTLLSLHFLEAGLAAGERCLMITLSQREDSIRQMIASHGFAMDDLVIHEMSAGSALEKLSEQQAIFTSSDLELEETSSELLEVVDEHEPQRVVFDAVSQLRLLANNPLLYRRQLLALRDYFAESEITVLLTDNQALVPGGGELQAIAHGTILLEHTVSRYGEADRTLEVRKCRNIPIVDGRHDIIIRTGGIELFTRLAQVSDTTDNRRPVLKTGNAAVDELLGGGPAAGTSTLLIGPAGSGKSTIAAMYACSAAQEGWTASVFLFDESPWTFIERSEGLGIPVRQELSSGRIRLQHVRPIDVSIGNLMSQIRSEVVEHGARAVVIDSLSGYLSAMKDEVELFSRMQQLLQFLAHNGVFTFLLLAQHRQGALGLMEQAHVSYLADAVLIFRTFEYRGSIRHGMAVYKKRYGNHERTIRELHLETGKVRVGAPLSSFSGMLAGAAQFHGASKELMVDSDDL